MIPNITITLKNENGEIAEKIIKAECRKWGLDYNNMNQQELHFIMEELRRKGAL